MKKWILVLVLLCGASVLHAQVSWQPLDNKAYEFALTSAIAVHQPSDNIIMTTINKGIFRSTDNGASWQNVFATDSSLQCVAVRSDGAIFVGGVRGYVFMSQDSGATWSRSQINTLYPISQIAFTQSGTIIAGTGVIEDREGIAHDAGDGVFVSADDGKTWVKKNTGISGVPCITQVAVAPSGRIWIAKSNWSASGSQGGLYYSDNNCESWNFLRITIDGKNVVGDAMDVRGIEALAFDHNGRMFISMRGADMAVSGGNAVACEFIAATNDITKPWDIIAVIPSSLFWMETPLFSLYITSNGAMWGSTIGGNSRGIFASDNEGETWERRHNGIIPAISGRYEPIFFAEQNNGTMYAVQWLDNHVYRAATPTDVRNGETSDISMSIAPNPVGQSTVVSFALPRTSQVHLAAVDLFGREVAVIAKGLMDAGVHRVAWNGSGVIAGMYYLVLRIDNGIMMQKTVYITN